MIERKLRLMDMVEISSSFFKARQIEFQWFLWTLHKLNSPREESPKQHEYRETWKKSEKTTHEMVSK